MNIKRIILILCLLALPVIPQQSYAISPCRVAAKGISCVCDNVIVPLFYAAGLLYAGMLFVVIGGRIVMYSQMALQNKTEKDKNQQKTSHSTGQPV